MDIFTEPDLFLHYSNIIFDKEKPTNMNSFDVRVISQGIFGCLLDNGSIKVAHGSGNRAYWFPDDLKFAGCDFKKGDMIFPVAYLPA